jgi:Mg2+/Co2+ transporter CorB
MTDTQMDEMQAEVAQVLKDFNTPKLRVQWLMLSYNEDNSYDIRTTTMQLQNEFNRYSMAEDNTDEVTAIVKIKYLIRHLNTLI